MNIDELLFQMYKDTVETGTERKRNELQKKYPNVNISNLHIRIVKYQVKKYGQSLNSRATNNVDYRMRTIKIENKRREENNGR